MNNKFVWAVIVVLIVIGFYLYSKPVAPVVLEQTTVTTETATTTVETTTSTSTPVSVSTTTIKVK